MGGVTGAVSTGGGRGRLIVGDGLRAVAALTILAFHTFQWMAIQRFGGLFSAAYGLTASHILHALNAGLFIFFALSGYLISRPFVNRLVLGERLPHLLPYAARRALRIIPAFWVALTATFVIAGTAGTHLPGLAAMYAFAQVYVVRPAFTLIPQGWTLDIEIAFYAFVPLAAAVAALAFSRLRTRPSVRAALLLVALVAASVASAASVLAANPLPWQTRPWQFLVAFAPGIALALFEPFVAGRVGRRDGRALSALCLALSAGCFVAVCLTLPIVNEGKRALLSTGMAGFLLAAALVHQWSTGRGWRLLSNRPAQWLGRRSYGIYLYHFLALTQVWKIGIHLGAWPTAIVFTLATAAVAIGAAALSWRFVEAPLLRLKRRSAVELEPDLEAVIVGRAPAVGHLVDQA